MEVICWSLWCGCRWEEEGCCGSCGSCGHGGLNNDQTHLSDPFFHASVAAGREDGVGGVVGEVVRRQLPRQESFGVFSAELFQTHAQGTVSHQEVH